MKQIAARACQSSAGDLFSYSEGMTMKPLFALAALLAITAPAWGTPGGLDASGCHHGKKVGYHCHAGAAKPARVASAPQARTAEERRLSRECKGRPNAGACAGYAR